jgi:uncharacterized cupin superfamily protein
MAGYAIRRLDELPSIPEGDVDWRPVQHYFGLTAFGINVYRATRAGAELIGEHDELSGGQEELYVVLSGQVRFAIGEHDELCRQGALVSVRDPALRPSAVAVAVAVTPDAEVLAIGDVPRERLASTWNARHFKNVPTVDG